MTSTFHSTGCSRCNVYSLLLQYDLVVVVVVVVVYCFTAAAYDLLRKKSRLFSFGSNNAFLEFFLQVRAGEGACVSDNMHE